MSNQLSEISSNGELKKLLMLIFNSFKEIKVFQQIYWFLCCILNNIQISDSSSLYFYDLVFASTGIRFNQCYFGCG